MEPYDILKQYFETLDKVESSPDLVFDERISKERYETLLMYSFRKYQAAVYHSQNVDRLSRRDQNVFENLSSQSAESIPEILGLGMQRSIELKVPADEYIYELSSFLEALKSSLDFLATVCAVHLNGVQADSINTLIKLVKKGYRGPVLDGIAASFNWLIELREYRHHLVHRLVFYPQSGYETTATAESASGSIIPVVVPRTTPKYFPDTRQSRAITADMEVPNGLSKTILESVVMDEDNRRIVSRVVEYSPADNYIEINDFMNHHLENWRQLLARLMEDLRDINFHKIKQLKS